MPKLTIYLVKLAINKYSIYVVFFYYVLRIALMLLSVLCRDNIRPNSIEFRN